MANSLKTFLRFFLLLVDRFCPSWKHILLAAPTHNKIKFQTSPYIHSNYDRFEQRPYIRCRQRRTWIIFNCVGSVSLFFLWLFARERLVQVEKNYIQILIQKVALFHIDFQFEWIFDSNGVCQRRRLRKAYEHGAFRALAIIPWDDHI